MMRATPPLSSPSTSAIPRSPPSSRLLVRWLCATPELLHSSSAGHLTFLALHPAFLPLTQPTAIPSQALNIQRGVLKRTRALVTWLQTHAHVLHP